MTDPLLGQKLPANVITPDVEIVMEAAPKPVHWVTFADKLSAADSATLMKLMQGGVGEPSE